MGWGWASLKEIRALNRENQIQHDCLSTETPGIAAASRGAQTIIGLGATSR
jgi:hypothetical protein